MPQSRSLIFSGRQFSSEEITLIKQVISANPTISRAALSRRICEDIKWFRPDGRLKDMRCRVVLLTMQDRGLVQLPPAKKVWKPTKKVFEHTSETDPQPIIDVPLEYLQPLSFNIITRKQKNSSERYNTLIQRYHYLGVSANPWSKYKIRN